MDKSQANQLKVIQNYAQVMVDGLRNSFPQLTEDQLRRAIDWSVNKRIYNGPASLDNNYTKRRMDGTVLDIIKYIETLEPILTSSGVLFKKHKEAANPMAKMIMGFLDKRAQYKKTMFKYPRGSAEFERYNLLQLLEKLNAKNIGLLYW